MKLLIVDSDRDWVEMLTGWLRTLGYEVYRAYTGEQAEDEWEKQQPDFVILDTELKDMDALAMCRGMQKRHDALVLAMNEEVGAQDEVWCLESGADDYLRKPFFPKQLLARIHAMSRRGCSILGQRTNSTLAVGPISMDTLRNEVNVGEKAAHLTPIESKLLHFLALNANNICTVYQIISHIWGLGHDSDANLIKAHIRHLRQKIEPDPGNPCYLLTVPGKGYTLIRHSDEEHEKHAYNGSGSVTLPWHVASTW